MCVCNRDENWVADYFDVTPYMSTYLVAFAIIDYPHVETVSSNGHVVGTSSLKTTRT